MTNPSIQTKYRPSLSLDEINTIMSRLDPIADRQLARKLHNFILKAQIGITAPAHITTPKQNLIDSLGFGESTQSNQSATAEQLYKIWESNPTSLSATQLAQVHHYRYTNDHMTPEEESNYELGM